MSDQKDETKPEGEDTPEGEEQAPVETPEEGVEETGNEDGDNTPSSEELPPEVLRKELTDARAEAANYRTKLRAAEKQLEDLQAKLEAATTPEAIEAVRQELTKEIEATREENVKLARQILVGKVARAHDLDKETTDLLSEIAEAKPGITEEDLTAKAKVLARSSAGAEPDELHGGLDPSGRGEESYDPRVLRRKPGRR